MIVLNGFLYVCVLVVEGEVLGDSCSGSLDFEASFSSRLGQCGDVPVVHDLSVVA